jgi:hypothetical protein
MFVCFANLWEIEVFFSGKSLGCTGGLYRSLRAFLRKYGSYIFFGKVRD